MTTTYSTSGIEHKAVVYDPEGYFYGIKINEWGGGNAPYPYVYELNYPYSTNKGNYIDTIEAEDKNAYPEDGV